jgi:hypothetical protein
VLDYLFSIKSPADTSGKLVTDLFETLLMLFRIKLQNIEVDRVDMNSVMIEREVGSRPITHTYNRRREARITLLLRLFLRRPINDSSYKKEVETDNVSRQGARVICDVKLNIGDKLEVSGLEERFSATAVVRHVAPRRDGRWAIGLKFLNKSGRWIIS